MYNKIKNFLSNKSGQAAIIFAISSVPIFGAVALAVDYSAASSSRVELKAAVESTSLSLARMSVKHQDMTASELQRRGKEMINLKMGQPVIFNTFDIDTRGVSVKIDANLDYMTTFGQILGKEKIEVSALSETKFEIADIDFYMLLDNSPSMAVGATPSDIAAMETLTKESPTDEGCAFACHTDEASQNTYNLAKAQGITLRMDAVKDALTNLTKRMEDRESINQIFRVSAVSMGEREDDFTPLEAETILELSNDYDNIRDVTENLEVLKVPSHSFPNRQTDYAQVFKHMRKLIRADIAEERGKSNSRNRTKERVMFFVSDGLNDSIVDGVCDGAGSRTRCMKPIDVNLCEQIKRTGTQIAVLHTLYYPIENNSFWRNNVEPQQDAINENMKQCASTGMYYAVDFQNGAVDRAMIDLFDKTLENLQITNLN